MYFVLKNDDIEQFLTDDMKLRLSRIARRVAREREKIGKSPVNEYLVVNRDEAFIGAMYDIMRSNGIILK